MVRCTKDLSLNQIRPLQKPTWKHARRVDRLPEFGLFRAIVVFGNAFLNLLHGLNNRKFGLIAP